MLYQLDINVNRDFSYLSPNAVWGSIQVFSFSSCDDLATSLHLLLGSILDLLFHSVLWG